MSPPRSHEDRSRTYPAPGVTLHALERNPSGSPHVVFTHGWLDHCHSHDWLRDALPPSWHTVALDFRGHGQSGHVPGGLYHFTDYLADLEFTLDACGIEKAHLVGHSLGGSVAMIFAGARPSRVLSVTSIESVGPTGGRDPSVTVHRARSFLEDLHRPLRRRTYASVADAAAKLRENNKSLSENAALHFATYGTRAVDGGVEFTFDPAHRRMFGTTLDEDQVLALFRAVECPVRWIVGTRGFSFEGEQLDVRRQALRAPEPVAVEGGHHVHLEQPAKIAELISAFIGEH